MYFQGKIAIINFKAMVKTQIFSRKDISYAVKLLQEDQLIAFPTETVFGLGANAFSDKACQAIYEAKGRPQDNPFIIHIASLDYLHEVAMNIPDIAYDLFQEFSPGPLTIILAKTLQISPVATANLASVAVRIPNHPTAQALLKACPFPLAAPSANRSGRPSPTNTQMVMQELQGRIAGILDGDASIHGLESTVISCMDEENILLLRPGAISLERLQHFLSAKGLNIQIHASSKELASPGTRHAHYQPAYPLRLVHQLDLPWLMTNYADKKLGILCAGSLQDQNLNIPALWQIKIFGNIEDFARQLYHSLIEFEQQGVQLAYAQLPDRTGLGLALCDRLQRAAAQRP